MQKQKKGLSLIVLVITIIVMLVLASAVIITLSNTNIISKAKDAVNKTNEKAYEQQADLYASDLMIDFRTSGIGKLIVSDYTKEQYINALKKGKTEEEAKEIANDSFIGASLDYNVNKENNIVQVYLTTMPYLTPEYAEVKRVLKIIDSLYVEEVELNIDEELLPADLVKSLEAYSSFMTEYNNGNKTDEDFEEFYYSNEPLTSLLEEDPNGKYYSYIENSGTLRLPYYVYDWINGKKVICKIPEYDEDWSHSKSHCNKIKKVIVDENYVTLGSHALPPVSGDCEIVLPNTLKKIEKFAFWQVMVDTIVIPSGVESIESGAFLKAGGYITNLIIKKEKGSIPGEPWGLDTTKTTITWQPE